MGVVDLLLCLCLATSVLAKQRCCFTVISTIIITLMFPAPSALAQLLSHLPSLLSLNLQSCSLLNDATLLPLSSSSPYLTSLTLSGCSLVSDPSLLAIASRLSYLQALALAYTQVSLSLYFILYCIEASHKHSIY